MVYTLGIPSHDKIGNRKATVSEMFNLNENDPILVEGEDFQVIRLEEVVDGAGLRKQKMFTIRFLGEETHHRVVILAD